MNVQTFTFRISDGLFSTPFAAIMITNKLRGMVNENAITLIIDSGAIMFGKANSKIMLLKHFPRSVDPFGHPTFLTAEEVNRIGCDTNKFNIWKLIFKDDNLFGG